MKNIVVVSKIFPSRISERNRKAKEVNVCQKGNEKAPCYGAQRSNQSWIGGPARPEPNTPLLLPSRNLLVWYTFHSFLFVLCFHSLEVLLGGRHSRSGIWVIVALLLEKCKWGATRIPFFDQDCWCTGAHTFSWRGMWHLDAFAGGAFHRSEVGIPSGVCPRGTAEGGGELPTYSQGEPEPAMLTEPKFWHSFSLIPLGIYYKPFRKYLNLPGEQGGDSNYF